MARDAGASYVSTGSLCVTADTYDRDLTSEPPHALDYPQIQMSGPESTANLTPWVPLAVRQWIHASDPEVKHRVVQGSTLFADISGFTKLSERLDRIGLEGAEQVTEVIADAFNRLLEPAYSYGGTLVKFGGDALLLFYQGEDH